MDRVFYHRPCPSNMMRRIQCLDWRCGGSAHLPTIGRCEQVIPVSGPLDSPTDKWEAWPGCCLSVFQILIPQGSRILPSRMFIEAKAFDITESYPLPMKSSLFAYLKSGCHTFCYSILKPSITYTPELPLYATQVVSLPCQGNVDFQSFIQSIIQILDGICPTFWFEVFRKLKGESVNDKKPRSHKLNIKRKKKNHYRALGLSPSPALSHFLYPVAP